MAYASLSLVALLGCPAPSAPDPDAVAAYLEGHAPAASEPQRAPLARRLAITVERAQDLPDLDAGPGVSDPYVILEYDGARHRTSVIDGDLNPVWGETFIFDATPGAILIIQVMDQDALSSDDLISTQSVVPPDLRVGESQPLDVPLQNGARGTLSLTLTGMARP